MKTIAQKMIAAGAGLFLTTNVAVYGTTTLYNNSTVDTGTSLSFINGTTIGNEITMAGGSSSYSLSSFSFEIVSPETAFIGSPSMEIFLYANNGIPAFNGYDTPKTVLYDSGLFSLSTPYVYDGSSAPPSPNYGATLLTDLSGSPITVPSDFTLAVEVTGLAAGDSLGMEFFDPATVGSNFGDYWQNNGTGWQLDTVSSVGNQKDFGAEFFGSATPAPDAASTAMLLGAALSGLALLRRKLS
jgi:hypothetical protein